MTKESLSDLNLLVKIVPVAVEQRDLEAFLEEVKKAKKAGETPPTIEEYIKKNQQDLSGYAENSVIIPVVSGLIEGLDLSNVDFTGARFKEVQFQFCTLNNTSFCDADLKTVSFDDCEMQNADMRGADLSTVKFEGYGEKELHKLDGIKFSTTKELLTGYLQDNEAAKERQQAEFKDKKNQEIKDLEEKHQNSVVEQTEEINVIEKALKDAYSKLSWQQATWIAAGYKSGDKEYDTFAAEKKKLEDALKGSKVTFEQNKKELERQRDAGLHESSIKYEFSPSLLKVIERSGAFDPAYPRGASEEERQKKRCYVKLEREDVEKYLAELKSNKSLEINDFAKKLATDKGIQIPDGEIVVADLSPRYGKNSKLEELDLSTLDFTGANLQNACFSGAILRECNFTNANLQNASFESADLSKATFHKTDAKDANFYHARFDKVKIENSNFRRAFMRASDAPKVDISDSNFDFTNIRNGNWEDAKIEDATFNYADMEGVSLARADLKRVQMQHAILNNAVMEECKIIESDLQKAYMEGVNARKAEIRKSNLDEIKAQKIDFTEAEIKELSAEGADLRGAVIRKMNAQLASFRDANMSNIQAEGARLEGVILENANLRFAKLRGAVLDKAEAKGVDMSGAFMNDMSAREANFKGAILRGVQAEHVNFTDSNLTKADLENADLENAILKNVDLVKAKLGGANLKDVDVENANFEKAEIDAAVVFEVKNPEKAQDNSMVLVHENGSKEKITPVELVKKQEEIKKEEAKNPLLAKVAEQVQGGTKWSRKALDWVKKGFSGERKKYARIIGGLVGAIVVGAFVASIVATGGASLAVAAGVIVGGVVIGAAAGAISAHFLADRIGISSTAGAVVGGVIGGAPGILVGAVVGEKINNAVKAASGESVGEIAENRVQKALDGVDKMLKPLIIDPKIANGIAEKKEAEKRHAEEKLEEEPVGKGANIELARMEAKKVADTDIIPKGKVEDAVAKIEKSLEPTPDENDLKTKIGQKVDDVKEITNGLVRKATEKFEKLKEKTEQKEDKVKNQRSLKSNATKISSSGGGGH